MSDHPSRSRRRQHLGKVQVIALFRCLLLLLPDAPRGPRCAAARSVDAGTVCFDRQGARHNARRRRHRLRPGGGRWAGEQTDRQTDTQARRRVADDGEAEVEGTCLSPAMPAAPHRASPRHPASGSRAGTGSGAAAAVFLERTDSVPPSASASRTVSRWTAPAAARTRSRRSRLQTRSSARFRSG